MDRTKLDTVIALVSRLLQPAGYECIEAEWAGNDRVLRLFIDRVEGAPVPEGKKPGVDLDDCVKASKLLDEVAELDAAIDGTYNLEVSSPGVERPLRRLVDFEKHLGQTVEVKLADKIDDRRHGTGKLVAVAKDTQPIITLETKRGPWSFPHSSLQRASLVYDWGDH